MKYHSKSQQEYTLWSLPAWECGLKSHVREMCDKQGLVTPCVGVWIEIVSGNRYVKSVAVTPCVGVWIEITLDAVVLLFFAVTPCVGVWIEIHVNCKINM